MTIVFKSTELFCCYNKTSILGRHQHLKQTKNLTLNCVTWHSIASCCAELGQYYFKVSVAEVFWVLQCFRAASVLHPVTRPTKPKDSHCTAKHCYSARSSGNQIQGSYQILTFEMFQKYLSPYTQYSHLKAVLTISTLEMYFTNTTPSNESGLSCLHLSGLPLKAACAQSLWTDILIH